MGYAGARPASKPDLQGWRFALVEAVPGAARGGCLGDPAVVSGLVRQLMADAADRYGA